MRYAIATAAALVLVVAVVLGLVVTRREVPPVGASPVAVSSATPAPSASPSASPTPPGTYENAVLGCRVTLPTTYRRSASTIYTSQPQLLGRDSYTTLTEAQERELCLTDAGDVPSLQSATYLYVEAYHNSARAPAAEWIRGRAESSLETVEPAALGGRDAVRLVQQGQTMAYVIGANDRM